jgi:hypothetical protein
MPVVETLLLRLQVTSPPVDQNAWEYLEAGQSMVYDRFLH